jgi:hypothetical protein
MIRHKSYLVAVLYVCMGAGATRAVEPNETFGERTILGSGVILVEDDLTPGFESFPDTMLESATSSAKFTSSTMMAVLWGMVELRGWVECPRTRVRSTLP